MKIIKNLLFLSWAVLSVSLVGCGKDDTCEVKCEANQVLTSDCKCVAIGDDKNVIVNANITANTTWTKDKTYHLAQRVTVTSGVTLTIEAGTVIKGQAGSGANATALLIARGAKIDAQGTASAPIIFTSVADEIVSGQIKSPNLEPNVSGLWGGLIILGKAPISAAADAIQIEGIPPSDVNGLYGGTDAADNSGIIKYVSIRHGGANIGEGNEINGLTLGGVGNGTVVENIEIIGNSDDGIECFGGTVNVKNIIVWNSGDDAYDMDQAYSGTIDNFVAILGNDSDHALELDGPEGAVLGAFTLKNGTVKGSTSAALGEYADLRDKVRCTLENIYFYNFKEDSDLELDNAGVSDNWFAGNIIFKNLEFNVSHLAAGNITLDKIFKDDGGRDAELNTAAIGFAKVVTSPSTGAVKSAFNGWTWSEANGELVALR